jgi:quinol monooxygenase YgiN
MIRTFFAEFTLDVSRRDQFSAVFEEYTAKFRDYHGTGCQYYEFMVHPTDPTRVFVYEQWNDDETFAAQLVYEPFQELRKKIKDLGIERITLYGFEAESPSTHFSGTPEELPSAEDMFEEDGASPEH